MIFVDTGIWFASFVSSAVNHNLVRSWISANREPLITSDYVIDETLTLLRARRQPEAALMAGRAFFDARAVQIHYLDASDIQSAWHVFRQFADKEWSFTDCTSKVVMERLNIQTALTFDHHFRQFGNVTVLP